MERFTEVPYLIRYIDGNEYWILGPALRSKEVAMNLLDFLKIGQLLVPALFGAVATTDELPPVSEMHLIPPGNLTIAQSSAGSYHIAILAHDASRADPLTPDEQAVTIKLFRRASDSEQSGPASDTRNVPLS